MPTSATIAGDARRGRTTRTAGTTISAENTCDVSVKAGPALAAIATIPGNAITTAGRARTTEPRRTRVTASTARTAGTLQSLPGLTIPAGATDTTATRVTAVATGALD
jgi:hypothetical protein